MPSDIPAALTCNELEFIPNFDILNAAKVGVAVKHYNQIGQAQSAYYALGGRILLFGRPRDEMDFLPKLDFQCLLKILHQLGEKEACDRLGEYLYLLMRKIEARTGIHQVKELEKRAIKLTGILM